MINIDLNGIILDCRIKKKPIAAISLQTFLDYGKVPLFCKECGLRHTYEIKKGKMKVVTDGMD